MSNETRTKITDIFQQGLPDQGPPEKGQRDRVYVIAEVGSNHGGNLERALEYIDVCASASVDAVKFQSWSTAQIQNSLDPDTGELHAAFPVLQKYELPGEWHSTLKERCDANGIDFLSTPFDPAKARLLRALKVPAIKIASGDLTYIQLLKEVGGYGIPILLSTGMANENEINQAISSLGNDAWRHTILLHCVGAYPPDYEDANIRAVQTLANRFKLPVGISDHYPGYTTVIAAISLGARVVEKHVTFSRNDGAPDSPFALEIDEFKDMVDQIRLLEKALGDGIKNCRLSEKGGLSGGRRSLYWKNDLEPNQAVSETDISALRPNRGDYQPVDLNDVIKRKLIRAVRAGHPVMQQDFEQQMERKTEQKIEREIKVI